MVEPWYDENLEDDIAPNLVGELTDNTGVPSSSTPSWTSYIPKIILGVIVIGIVIYLIKKFKK